MKKQILFLTFALLLCFTVLTSCQGETVTTTKFPYVTLDGTRPTTTQPQKPQTPVTPAPELLVFTLSEDETYYSVKADPYYTTSMTYHSYDQPDVVIPETHEGKPVKVIDSFRGCKWMKSITLPDTITEIGSSAFSGCTGLETVHFPKGITNIEPHLFSGCSGITTLTVDEENERYYSVDNCIIEKETQTLILGCNNSKIPHTGQLKAIGDYAFASCDAFTVINIPHGVTSIGRSAFQKNSNVTKLYLPETLQTIGDYAFAQCSQLPDLQLPSQVTAIGSYAFSDCFDLTEVSLSNVKRIGEKVFDGCQNLSVIRFHSGLETVTSALFQSMQFQSVILPDTVRTIEANAFQSCTVLEIIYLPEGLQKIGAHAFDGCSNLKIAVIPDTVTTIGSNAFQNCSSLTKLSIPKQLTSIAPDAFAGCNGLQSITAHPNNPRYYTSSDCLIDAETKTLLLGCNNSVIPQNQSITAINDYAFYHCYDLEVSRIPDGVISIGNGAFSHCYKIETLLLPKELQTIGNNAFNNCHNLKELCLPETLTKIGNYAFTACAGIESIQLPATLEFLGKNAFAGCRLTEITVPGSVKAIAPHTFSNCEFLRKVILEEGITSIGTEAFFGLTFPEVSFPDSLIFVEKDAFYTYNSPVASYENGCYLGSTDNPYLILIGPKDDQIRSLTVHPDTKIIADSALEKCLHLEKVTFNDQIVSIGKSAFSYTRITEIVLPDSVCAIGKRAFEGCIKLERIVLPHEITTVEESTFAGCSGLVEVTLSQALTFIGQNAFQNCTALSKLTFTCQDLRWYREKRLNSPINAEIDVSDPAQNVAGIVRNCPDCTYYIDRP